MAVIIVFDFPGMTQAHYEQVTNEMSGGHGLIHHLKGWPAPGLISHAAGPSPTGWFVTDVWESEEAFKKFGEKLAPLMQAAGMPLVEPTIYPAFNVVTD